MSRFLRSPFGSALLGGTLVGALFVLAISSGWIEAEGGGGDTTVALSEPLAAPVATRVSDDEGANTVGEIYRRDGRGVAFISASGVGGSTPSPFGQPEGEGGAATGSGFLIDTDGHVVTNSHVVEGADEVSVTLGAEDTAYDAEIVGTDPATDVALLRIDAPAERLHPLALGDSTEVEVGDPVVAIGNPFGLDRTVTAGIVSALQRQIQAPNGFSISHVIQTDAAINPGNSGGPLINANGEVIGINSQIQTGGSSGNVGIGFAVPVNTARDVVRQLQEDGEVEHAFLGISGGSVTPDLARTLRLPVDEGILISEVVEGGPADEAGVKGGNSTATVEGASIRVGGDIVVAIDGKPVTEMEEVINAVNGAEAGDEMELTVRRGEDEKKLVVTLGERPATASGSQPEGEAPPSE